ncbi:MAG: AI-2E family transporter [Kiritimatiellae bacterium]|nr:AI-2E family transporter [Kiritimatiellia bacterium]
MQNDTEKTRGIAFTPRQASIVAAAAALLAFSAIAAVVAAALLYGLRFVSAHSSVLLPPLAAIILAQVVRPMHDATRRFLWRLVPRRTGAAAQAGRARAVLGTVAGLSIAIVLLSFLLPAGAFLWYFGSLVVQQIAGIAERVPDALRWAWSRLPDIKSYLEANGLGPVLARVDPASWFDAAAIAEGVRQRAFAVAGGVPAFFGTVSSWLMVVVYLAIYLASRPLGGADFTKALVGVSDRTRESARFLIDEFIRIVVAFFRGQVVVAIVEGALFGLGFQFAAGLPYGLTLGLLVGFVNIVPYMGSVFVMPLVALFAYFGAGGAGTLVGVLAVWAAVGLADFYISPAIVGDRTGLGAFAVIFSLLFWGETIGGFAGLFLAVPLSAFIAVAWRFISKEYLGGGAAAAPAPAAPGARE